MNMMMVLQAGKLVNSVLNPRQKKQAKLVANEQKITQEKFYNYNKKQLERAYDIAFSNTMTNYVNDRMNMTEQYKDMESKLNELASQTGINLANSSFDNDIQNQLNIEFETNLQDQYSNLMDQATQLAIGKTSQDLQLQINNMNKIKQIQETYNSTKNKFMNDIVGNAMDLFGSTVNDFQNYKSKQNLKDKNKDVGITDYIADDLLKFKW